MSAEAGRASVIVQAYNTEAFVGDCIASVLGQTGSRLLEVIVINDASKDGTAKVIESFRDPRLQIIHHAPNTGAIATANEGYGRARGEYVLRIDSDDRLRPEFLAQACGALDAHPECGIAYANVAIMDAAGEIMTPDGCVNRRGRPAVGNELFALLMENFIPAPGTLVRREALAPLLPIPAHFRFLDWYLTTGIADGWDSVYVDRVLADYRLHGDNMHRAMVLDGTGERTSLEVIERVLGRETRAEEKRAWAPRVYARHYLTYADKYLGCGMVRDARRCYFAALRRQPSWLADREVSRHLAASIVGLRIYGAAKALLTGTRA